MRKLSPIAAAVVVVSLLSARAQEPPTLEIFKSPDGGFQFVYPETYELLTGERILKATQGRHVVLPVCDFSKAMACVIYPVETERETRLEAAGFSVDAVAGVANEADCLAFSDPSGRSLGTEPQTSVSINARLFRHTSVMKRLPGHIQAADFYRVFTRQKCYQLQIAVSVADAPVPQKVAQSSSLADAAVNTARESLRLILSSVVFGKE